MPTAAVDREAVKTTTIIALVACCSTLFAPGGGVGRCRAVAKPTAGSKSRRQWRRLAVGMLAVIETVAGAVLVAGVVFMLGCRCCSGDDV